MITGRTDNSRLGELKKFAVGVPFSQQYIGNGSWTTDGVNYANSPTIEYVVYYIGGIRYVDQTLIDGTQTTFSYTPQGTSSPNFINEFYIKNPNKDKIISNPKIINDVFIIRDDLSAFDKNYRLEYINNLRELTTYAGGKYFNIVNNT